MGLGAVVIEFTTGPIPSGHFESAETRQIVSSNRHFGELLQSQLAA
jgi:hypothetical protein